MIEFVKHALTTPYMWLRPVDGFAIVLAVYAVVIVFVVARELVRLLVEVVRDR